MRSCVTVGLFGLCVVFAAGGARASAQAQNLTALRTEITRELSRERDLRKIEVVVEGDQIILRGQVQTLWVKQQAIARALKVRGVDKVISEISVTKTENDKELAARVTEAIQRYEHGTIWDYITGSIKNGVVTLRGKVTSFPDKSRDLAERIAKVRGVQDLRNELHVITPSRSDDELRARLAQRIFSSQSFEQFAGAVNPPFHIVVENGIVTLIGYVQGQAELIEIQQIVGQTEGLLRVDNQLQTLTRR